MTLRKAIKFNAKKCLKNNWGRAILILVILTAVNLVLGALDNAIFSAMGFERVKIDWDILRDTIYQFDAQEISPAAVALSLLLSLIRLCIMAPLALGAANWALELSDGRSNSIGELFWAFDNAAWYRSVWMRITVAVKTGLFSFALEVIPTVMVTVGRINLMENRPAGVTLILIGGVLAVAAAPVTMWFGARYFAVDLLLCDRYYYTVREATKLSVEMTKGRRWQIVGFYLSFIPWYLLCCLIAKKAGAQHTIARVRNPEYDSQLSLITDDLGLSLSVNPELTCATEIARRCGAAAADPVGAVAAGRQDADGAAGTDAVERADRRR